MPKPEVTKTAENKLIGEVRQRREQSKRRKTPTHEWVAAESAALTHLLIIAFANSGLLVS
jgi:hypothetical protein